MTLDGFFRSVSPFLRGEGSADALRGVDVERWRLYGQFCEVHRAGILKSLFPLTRARMTPHQWSYLLSCLLYTSPSPRD